MIEVVSGILIRDGKCLIASRSYGSSKGMFEFPGGKVEAGESKEEALKREWKEELGIELESIRYFASSQDQQDYRISLDFFLCTSKEIPVKSNAHDQLVWTVPNQIYDFPFFESDYKIVEKLKEYWPCFLEQKKPKY